MNYSDSDSKIWLQLLGKCFLWCKHNACVCPAPTLSFQSDLLVGFRLVHMDLSIFVVRMRSCLYLTSSAQRREKSDIHCLLWVGSHMKRFIIGSLWSTCYSIEKKNIILNARELLKNLIVLLFISWSSSLFCYSL